MAYNLQLLITKLTTLKTNADNLITAINYRAEELGANSTTPHTVVYNIPSNLVNSLESEIDSINSDLVLSKLRLDGITYGLGPTGYTPYVTFGPSGPDGPWGRWGANL